MTSENTNPNTYQGNCHCGRFRFQISLPKPLTSGLQCNCSVCSKKGCIWNDDPVLNFTVTHGQEQDLSVYSVGDGEVQHRFCPQCGTAISKQMKNSSSRLFNLRALRNVAIWSLELKDQAATSFPPEITASPLAEHLSTVAQPPDEALKLYTGSCHCGKVRVSLRSDPLKECEVKEDNCSICQRNANICIYPTKPFISITGIENTREYTFGRKFNGHRFCSTCGVAVYMEIHGPPKEVWERLPEATKERLAPNFEIVPLRVAVLDGVDVASLSVKRNDEGMEGYEFA